MLTGVLLNHYILFALLQSSDMLSFMVTQLQKYVLKSSASLNTNEGKAQRADEIQ